VSPSAAMTKDLARNVSFPPVDAIATKEAYHKLTWVGLAILHGLSYGFISCWPGRSFKAFR
jgi:hypothetical protein